MAEMLKRLREGNGDMSLSDQATIYRCCGLFDLCNDQDLMSLSLEGTSPFLDWLTWRLTDLCVIRKSFITYTAPEHTFTMEGKGPEAHIVRNCSPGYLADPCEDPYGTEWGKCEFELRDFGRLRRHSPTRDITMNAVRLCEAQPRYRLDGTMITDDREFDIRVVTETLLQDLKRMIITGAASTPGMFDGLNALVKTNYTDPTGQPCHSMDSNIIDWNGNQLAGGAGITWNGTAIGATYDFVDVLLAAFRRVMQRISWAPVLNSQRLRVGDIVLVMPTFMTRCLLDMYTCWSVCPNVDWEEGIGVIQALNTFEARTYRNQLNGGMFGAGRIYLDGFEIPLIAYDWGLQQGPTTADVYMLTGSVGNVRVLEGQLLDMRKVPGGSGVSGYYSYTDGGKILTWPIMEHTCVQQIVEMRPRILAWAPWAQVRFEDVVCNQPGGNLSPDPCEGSFFPETSFVPAECPGADSQTPI